MSLFVLIVFSVVLMFLSKKCASVLISDNIGFSPIVALRVVCCEQCQLL